MKYMLLVCWDAERMNMQDEPEEPVSGDESFPWLDDVQARGIWMTGDQLAPTRRARTVRVRDGKKLVTDFPGSTSSSATASTRPSRSQPRIQSRSSGRSRSGRSSGTTRSC